MLQYARAVRPVELPPRGPFHVGRTVLHLNPQVHVWYPASPGAPVPHPLIILSPAMGRGPLDYAAIAADLASFGYVVAGVTPTATGPIDLQHRERAQPLVETWIADFRHALDQLHEDPQFRGRIAWNRIGLLGHSFGGAAAIQALAVDDRFQRAVNMDGAPQGKPVTGLRRPALFILGAPLPPDRKALNDQILTEIHATCDSGAGCQILDYPQAGHMNFSDAGLTPSPIRLLRARQDLTEIDGAAFLRQIVDRLLAFFSEM